MDRELYIQAPLEHPCYSGHFPGAPILPGVVLLDLIVTALERGAPRVLGSVKFHRAVRPGEALKLRYKTVGPQLSFRCELGAELVAEGSLSFGNGA